MWGPTGRSRLKLKSTFISLISHNIVIYDINKDESFNRAVTYGLKKIISKYRKEEKKTFEDEIWNILKEMYHKGTTAPKKKNILEK